MNVQVSLPLKDWAVPNDIVAAVRQPQEHGHDERQKQVRWNMKSRSEIILRILGVSQHKAYQRCQNWRFENGGPKVCPIAQFADKRPFQNRVDANPLVAPARGFFLVARKR